MYFAHTAGVHDNINAWLLGQAMKDLFENKDDRKRMKNLKFKFFVFP